MFIDSWTINTSVPEDTYSIKDDIQDKTTINKL